MGKKLNKLEFIDRSMKKHGDVYDYSNVNYVHIHKNVKIKCPKHGEFEQSPNNHFRYGCKECGYDKIKNSEKEFIKKCNMVHNNKYDYSKVLYEGSKKEIIVICENHGEFKVTPEKHLKGSICKECSIEKKRVLFIERSNKVHKNKYTYYYYKNSYTKVKIKCPKHGDFNKLPHRHLKGSGCPKCSKESERLTIKEFIQKSNKIHDNYYNYSKVLYLNSHKKVKIKCPKHGIFEQKPNNHLSGQGCSLCSISKGERRIIKYLKDNQIEYEYQKIFKDCYYKKCLMFDFYLPKQNICIEYDGEQHYVPIRKFGGEKTFKIIKIRDGIKNKYCLENNITMLRIPYTEFSNIRQILNKGIVNDSIFQT